MSVKMPQRMFSPRVHGEQSFNPQTHMAAFSSQPAFLPQHDDYYDNPGGSQASMFYRPESPLPHHPQQQSYVYHESPTTRHLPPGHTRGAFREDRASPPSVNVYVGPENVPQVRTTYSHRSLPHHHVEYPPPYVDQSMPLPHHVAGHSQEFSAPSQIFAGGPHHRHMPEAEELGHWGPAIMVNPAAPAVMQSVLPPISVVDPMGAHELTSFSAMTGANLEHMPFASPHYPGVGGVGYPNAMVMCRSIEALPGPGSYGHPRHPSFAKPDYRRFCFSVGRADVPYAAVGQTAPPLGM